VADRACFGFYADRRALPTPTWWPSGWTLAIDELLGLIGE